MTSVTELYEQISSAPDEKTRARLLMEALRHIERRLPAVHNLDTHAALRDTEHRLQKETHRLRSENRQMERRLRMEIEGVREENRRMGMDLHRQLLKLETEIQRVQTDFQIQAAQRRVVMMKWVLVAAVLLNAMIIFAGVHYFLD
ncbi:hypothetical protein [Ectothiorhodospira mobilis]|uniref:hypothetical protein n=1 Tax=Ectothiorhodospira mobilis TaxID=195064 RepID=UPI0019060E77|nr:hypothetical protein [Ectothiorhodospira mobilis]MBK1692863.1 hypothetical protein [Ectothiorhodospira mobilis]